MSEEVKKEELIVPEAPTPAPIAQGPMSQRDEVLFVYSTAAGSVAKYLEEAVKLGDEKKAPAEVNIEGIFYAIREGIAFASEQIQKGLVPVDVQEFQVLNVFRGLRAGLKPGESIKFKKVFAENPAGLVGADGRPINPEVSKLIVPK